MLISSHQKHNLIQSIYINKLQGFGIDILYLIGHFIKYIYSIKYAMCPLSYMCVYAKVVRMALILILCDDDMTLTNRLLTFRLWQETVTDNGGHVSVLRANYGLVPVSSTHKTKGVLQMRHR